MMTNNALVRSIHAANRARFALWISKTDKGQLEQLLVLAGSLSMEETAYQLNISFAQQQADRNSAALQIADRYNVVRVVKHYNNLLFVSAVVAAALAKRRHPVMLGVGFGDALNVVAPLLLTQGRPAYFAAYSIVWLQTCASNQPVGRSITASAMHHTVRFIFEEHNPCQA